MPTFPTKEADIIALAQIIASGIQNNPTIFPNPPVVAADIFAQVAEYHQFREEIAAAESLVSQKRGDKGTNIADTTEMLKSIILYVEMIARGNEAILAKIGWGARAHPTALTAPGQCRALEISGQGNGWVRLVWKEPSDGGKVAAYQILRSEDGIAFSEVASDTRPDHTLVDQPTGKRLTYQVVGFNKAGEGMASNTVSLVL